MDSYRNRGYSSGGFSMGFPPFTRALKRLMIINAAVYLLMLLIEGVAPGLGRLITDLFWLRPSLVLHGLVWQVVTYAFFHAGLFHVLFNMLGLWMFGATLESEWGSRRFQELYFFGAVGAAVSTIAVAYLGTVPLFYFLGIGPRTATLGASGAIFAVMVAFAMLHGDQQFMMFPLPFTIRAKYLVGIWIFIALAGTFQGFSPAGRGQSVAYVAHLGGALCGWIYVRFLPGRGMGFSFSESYFRLRNSYYRWKRRRAGRKFEVYMRKQGHEQGADRSYYFDENGNFRDPKGGGNKGNGERRGPWVH
jgi:membrane associated rhomboid family serine protease